MAIVVRENRPRPRIPLKANLDLTYRCNNACRHCWLWLPAAAPEASEELDLQDVRRIVDEARALGCARWSISGGEPMLRPDFYEIVDYITRKAISCDLNTNGTLITPLIAHLLVRPGEKMVALYGATSQVHDHITRNPGSFEATLQGMAYLQEAGAAFTVQLVPMRDNWLQFQAMVDLARSLSPHYRFGAPWLWLSELRSAARNREISAQRLDPRDVVALDPPNVVFEERMADFEGASRESAPTSQARVEEHLPSETEVAPGQGLFANCIAGRREVHIDPYGQVSFCPFIKDTSLRYDLRRGTLQEAWERFIPSLSSAVPPTDEYSQHCGSCEYRADCRWCPAYAYLEHGRYTAPIDYLCRVAKESRHYREEWVQQHRRYYQIAGLTIQVDADLPITDRTFGPNLRPFEVQTPGEDVIALHHHFSLPNLDRKLGQAVYYRPPWAIYRHHGAWVYLGISPEPNDPTLQRVAVFDPDHAHGQIYNSDDTLFREGELHSLALFPSDQILVTRILADRQGCYLHSSGIILDGKGLAFVGHSDAGKSTMLKMLRGYGEILCDDRNIIRRWPDGFRIHGTWSHGELPDVSPSSAPLRAILFLEKATVNELVPVIEKRERLGLVLSHVVKALVTADWWEKTLVLAGQIATEVPVYRLRFDKSGGVVDVLKQL